MTAAIDDQSATTQALEQLAGTTEPFLIGVRHHSAVMARAIPELLDQFAPYRVLIELPIEFSPWLRWLGDGELQAPIALASTIGDGLSFYPFADFSPELAAIRWAISNQVPVEPCDLPLGERVHTSREVELGQQQGLLEKLFRQTQSQDVGQLWERLVETPGIAASAESIRRSGLLFGWALRRNDQVATHYDRRREQFMRQCIANGDPRCAVVVGAYHAAALLPEPMLWQPPDDGAESRSSTMANPQSLRLDDQTATALIPYSFEQLDERSGYPAGIRDPLWHQRVFEAGRNSSRKFESRPEQSAKQAQGRAKQPAGLAPGKQHADNEIDQEQALNDIDYATCNFVVAICRELRDADHPANAADGKEVLRMARDLARLRGLPVPGRGELIEAVQTCLTHGEIMGIGRAVAKSLQSVLIGDRQGQLAPGTPTSGLTPHLHQLLATLNLPGPQTIGDDAKRLRLDPLRSSLDRARSVTLQRLRTCSIPYAEFVEFESSQIRESLTELWDVRWQHATAAMIELVSARGATIEQVCTGTLMQRGFSCLQSLRTSQQDGRQESRSDTPRSTQPTQGKSATADRRERNQHAAAAHEEWTAAHIGLVAEAAECGIHSLTTLGLEWVMSDFLTIADLASLTEAMSLVERIRSGHVAGLPVDSQITSNAHQPNLHPLSKTDVKYRVVKPYVVPAEVSPTPLLQSAIGQLEGIRGSDEFADASALLDLILWFQQQPGGGPEIESGRLIWLLKEMRRDGSSLMQGAGISGLFLLDVIDEDEFGTQLSGWVSSAVDRSSRQQLRTRLKSAVLLASPKLTANPECLLQFERQIDELSDDAFLKRLPALRGGFLVLSPAARMRLLQELLARLPDADARGSQPLIIDPIVHAMRVQADEAGRQALAELMPDLVLDGNLGKVDITSPAFVVKDRGHQVVLPDRWRLILGVQQEKLAKNNRSIASALDELYGKGEGEGSRGGIGDTDSHQGGSASPYPGVREWTGDLKQFFGSEVCEEVLGDALTQGRGEVIASLDPETVTPSVELLEQVLSMKGALPSSQTEKLRKLTRRIIDQLVQELSNRLRPSLVGLSTPRPTNRKTRRLDLSRTIRANLHTARIEGREISLNPERFIFRQPARRSMDWHVTFVVDVSGSMEASVIYSAMMSAIFAGLPAVGVKFLAFSTEVIDFSERVADPLEMLLEVKVGGGTYIGKGLRAARESLQVPNRSIVILVTDFEEGWPVSRLLAEVRSLVATGAKCLGLAALNDEGKPRYNKQIAEQVVVCGMPVAALSPTQLARWVGEQIR